MSSCCISVCLLVVLGVVLVFGSPVTETLVQTHDSIADVLELKETEIGSRPLFTSVIKSISTSCQRKEQIQLMNATLDVYMHIFSSLLDRQHHDSAPTLLTQLNDSSRSHVEVALIQLQQRMENLKRHLGQVHHQNPNQEDMLKELERIKVDDPVDQRRALAQFKEVYQAASVIASRGCGSTH